MGGGWGEFQNGNGSGWELGIVCRFECWIVEETGRKGQGADGAGLAGLAGAPSSSGQVLPINHDPCYHGLYYLLSIIIVLVFSELTSFVRKISQAEENKGVELAGDGSDPTERPHGEVNSRQLKVESKET